MAGITELIFNERVTFQVFDPSTSLTTPIDTFSVDASIDEQHDLDIMITEHPVTRGVAITDNIRPEPDAFRITALFTDIGSRIDESIRKVVERYDHKTIYQKLKDCARNGFIFTITTSLEKYERMALKRVSAPRSSRMTDAVEVTLDFQEVRTASARRTEIEAPAAAKKPVEKKHGAKVNKGTQTTKAATPTVDDDNRGLLRVLTDESVSPDLYKGITP